MPSPSEIAKGERTETCQRCGGVNPSWSAPSPLWNAVMRGGSINGPWEYGEIICAACFMQLAEERGIASLFRVDAQQVNVELETITPTGRVWDNVAWLWRDPLPVRDILKEQDNG